MLTVADKNFHAELIFKEPYLFAYAGLRGKERLRRRGDVKVVIGDLPDIAELLKLHGTLVCCGRGSILSFGIKIKFYIPFKP